jgi:hypothetical protein
LDLRGSINSKTKRESDYIDALAKFFENAGQTDHHSRVLSFESAMEKLYQTYPDDIEAAVFYAWHWMLRLIQQIKPTPTKKGFSILNPIFQKEPLHPGIAHYIIHNCDYPALQNLPYLQQESMHRSHLLPHMRSICLRIYSRAWSLG